MLPDAYLHCTPMGNNSRQCSEKVSSVGPESKPRSENPDLGHPAPGPKPDLLKIEGDWQDALKQTLSKKKPTSGWPKEK